MGNFYNKLVGRNQVFEFTVPTQRGSHSLRFELAPEGKESRLEIDGAIVESWGGKSNTPLAIDHEVSVGEDRIEFQFRQGIVSERICVLLNGVPIRGCQPVGEASKHTIKVMLGIATILILCGVFLWLAPFTQDFRAGGIAVPTLGIAFAVIGGILLVVSLGKMFKAMATATPRFDNKLDPQDSDIAE